MNKLFNFGVVLLMFLNGCTTAPASALVPGRKKLLGLLPVPFTGDKTAPPASSEQMAVIHQLAIFHKYAIFLIIGGACIWYFANRIKAGKFFIGLGFSLSIFAVIMPQISGWVGAITVIGLFSISGVFAYDFVNKKLNKNKGTHEKI